MNRTLLLVDLSYQVYRAAAAHPMLSDLNNHFTGGLYGFFVSFAKAVRETGATDVAICTDVKPYLRSRAYPEYKQLRKKNRDDELLQRYEASTPMVVNALAAIGIDTWGVKGFEADDLIAHAAITQRNRFSRIVAASNDSDLWQLFGLENFSTFNKEPSEPWDGARLMKVHGLTPDQYKLATALMGTHNDIAGIPRVGEGTAFKAVRDDPALLRGLRAKHADLIERNLSLIQLPHPDFPGARIPPRREASRRDLYRALGRWDIEVTASMVGALEQLQG